MKKFILIIIITSVSLHCSEASFLPGQYAQLLDKSRSIRSLTKEFAQDAAKQLDLCLGQLEKMEEVVEGQARLLAERNNQITTLTQTTAAQDCIIRRQTLELITLKTLMTLQSGMQQQLTGTPAKNGSSERKIKRQKQPYQR